MGNHHGIEAQRIEGKRAAIALVLFTAPLAHAALEQHPRAIAAFDEVAGTGDLLDGTEKRQQSHGCDPSELQAVAPACREYLQQVLTWVSMSTNRGA